MKKSWVLSVLVVILAMAMTVLAYGCGSSGGSTSPVTLSLKVNT
jgi:hypothetical protein